MRRRIPLATAHITDATRNDRIADEFAESIAREPDAARLAARVAARLQTILGCAAVTYLDRVSERDAYVATYSTSPPSRPARSLPPTELTLDAHGGLARWLRVNDAPLVLFQTPDVLAYLPAVEREWLESLGAGACLPLVAHGALNAILLVHTDGASAWHPTVDDMDATMIACRTAAHAREALARHDAERARLETITRADQLAIAGHIATTIAHEVRNPLTAIRSSAQHLLDTPGDWQNAQTLMHGIITEVDRVNHAVSRTLRLSRTEELALVDLDLANAIDEALVLVQAHCHSHGLTLKATLEHPLPILGDANELRQVLLNLLLNASQATPAGGSITVTASMNRDDHGVMTARAVIADTGPGIPAPVLEHVFDPYFTTKPDGTGLGLPISSSIMNRHHGHLTIDSEVGRGTTARLVLPLRAH